MALDSYANLQATVLDWLARPGDPLVAPAVPDMILMFEEEARDRLQTRFTEKTVTLTPEPGSSTVPLPLDYCELREMWIDTANGRNVFTYQTPRNLDENFYFLSKVPGAFTIEGLNLRFIGDLGTAATFSGGSSTVTLTPNATTTIISDSRIGPSTLVGLMPLTSTAAAAEPSIWVDPEAGEATIHHANSPNADQDFSYTIGGVLVLAGSSGSIVVPAPLNLLYFSGLPALSGTVSTNWLLAQYPSAYLWGTLSYAAPYIGDDPRLPIWLTARDNVIERIRLADRRAKFPHGLMIQTDVRNP